VNLALEGRRFLVCGASRGLGRAVADVLAAEGGRVHRVARTTTAEDEHGSGATTTAADLGTIEGIAAVAAWVRESGPLDGVLINGGGPPPGAALSLDDDGWQQAFAQLVLGPVRLLRAIRDDLNDGSAVLFVTSSSVRQPISGLDSSNVLRPAVAALAKTLALQLAPRTRVNSLAPGRFDTDRVRELDTARANAAGVSIGVQRERACAAIPAGRYGDPAEFGRVAAFLLSPMSSYVNGAAIQADGGMVTSIP
jgi:3-oxoacyl-[acyl-carrier protein] reductase